MNPVVEQRLVTAVRRGLDQSVSSLDWQTQAKLTKIRLAVFEQPVSRWSWGTSLASLSHGFAAAAMVTLMTGLWLMPEETPTIPVALDLSKANVLDKPEMSANTGTDVSTMDVLLSNEDIEFLEDLDKYEWLVAQYG